MSEAMNPTHGVPPREGATEYQPGTTGSSPGSSDQDASAEQAGADPDAEQGVGERGQAAGDNASVSETEAGDTGGRSVGGPDSALGTGVEHELTGAGDTPGDVDQEPT
ncbi:MAG: hypothetical protein QOK10_857 [Pseudonocardiales bacterium]|nr:hypothetical protein [Pseudonocardiales bacterium]